MPTLQVPKDTPAIVGRTLTRDDVAIVQAWQRGNWDAVLAMANGALKANPGDVFARMFHGTSSFNLGHYDDAIADESIVLTTEPAAVMALQVRGASEYAVDRYQEAIADETRALALHETAFSHNYRGAARFMIGQYADAVSDLNDALTIDPRNTWAISIRGAAKAFADDPRGALRDLDDALQASRNDAYTRTMRGYARWLVDDYRGAIADETVALAQRPDVMAFGVRSLAETASHDFPAALRDAGAAVAAGGKDAFTYEALGDALIGNRMYGEAVKAYDAALKVNPDPDPSLRAKRAWAAAHSGARS
ncbi:MAG TPA: tetratricopeptide repeat protein [Candidatus Limnocylindria bacterium]|nr:tetratricopeptide repeat protein [Candidatus Limnocylindria bacterium]